jgi:hypothetical protein
MAIYIGGYLTDDKIRGITVTKAPTPVALQPAPIQQIIDDATQRQDPQNPVQYVKSQPRVNLDPDSQYLVVGGKAKQIGKKSKYLIDMLTTEE